MAGRGHRPLGNDRSRSELGSRPRAAQAGGDADAATVSTAPLVVPVQRSLNNERVASAVARAPVAYDRVLGLADALDGCALESPFARLACEQRARAHYCEGANGRIPQCADPPPREYRQ